MITIVKAVSAYASDTGGLTLSRNFDDIHLLENNDAITNSS